MKEKKSSVIAIFIIVCILVNCAGKWIANTCALPIWLDSIGTILAAYMCGPVCGAIVGASVNVIYSFSELTNIVYALTSIAVGITVGFCASRRLFRDFFGTMSASFFVSLLSVGISTPLNCVFYQGYTGNDWGDGVIDYLLGQGTHPIFCYISGEFYVDFLDKTLILCMLYLGLRFLRAMREKHKSQTSMKNPEKFHTGDTSGKTQTERASGKSKATTLGVLALCFLIGAECIPVCAGAEEADTAEDYSTYVQTVYNGENGLAVGTATDIAQTSDGVLWIGTYNGLYEYDGSQFEWMDSFESVKNVNCLYTDEEGRLWIGTNDGGLSVCIDSEIANVLDADDGMPSNSVRSIAGGNNGYYYVGTSDSLAVVTLASGISIVKTISEISYASSISVNEDGKAAIVTNGGEFYLVDGTEIVSVMECPDAEYTCCMFDGNGQLYVGRADNQVEIYTLDGNTPVFSTACACGDLSNSKDFYETESGDIFICADNGTGYLDADYQFHAINTNEFNSSIDHMLEDYQGNFWFSSSRLGLLKMCSSAFMEVYDKIGMDSHVANAVTLWNGDLYFGTDNGLDMADTALTTQKESALTEALAGVRIRHLMVDSGNRLWVATSGKGTWVVQKTGEITIYNSDVGTLGDKFRMSLELSDGTVLMAGDSGLTYIKNGAVSATIGIDNGLDNPKVLCLAEMSDGTILAGTDGNGIAVIKDGAVERSIKTADGLSSDVILHICAAGSGYFIVTGNGLCYMDEAGTIRLLENFPYYNNFNVISYGVKLFVLSSAGIYVVDRAALLSGEEIDYTLLDSKRGLENTLTSNSWTYQDEDGHLYLPESGGVTMLDMDAYDMSMRSYRLRLKSVTVDGTAYPVDQGDDITIQRGAKRVEIAPEIINYSANDPYVSVYLEGVDSEAQVVRQSELTNIVYSDLPAGSYTLYIAVLDTAGTTLSESRYSIYKEFEIYEHKWFLVYLVGVFALAVAYIVWLVFRTQIQRTLNIQKRELEIAQEKVRMSDETILTIARTVDARDVMTSQHSLRVSQYSVMIAAKIGYDEAQQEQLRKIALLHDIGKIGIPDRILNKPARLTDEEYAIMRSHVEKGAEILKNFTSIENVVDGALYHHERYDGKGYTHGLKGEEIPLNARIIGIADAFDAMTANRVYRKKLDMDYVIGELERGKGTQFDAKLVDVLLELIADGEIDMDNLYGQNATF